MEQHPLTVLPRALVEAGFEPVPYRRAYEAAINAAIPAKQGKNGRWTFAAEDLGTIADRLGLTTAHAA